MPELPEVETALRGISPYLKNFTIEKVVVRQPKLRWAVSEELITLKHVKIVDLTRRAKYLIIHTEKGYIISHRKRLYHWAFRYIWFNANPATG